MPVSVSIELDAGRRRALLTRARRSIEHGCAHGEPRASEAELPDWLQQPLATFVTLMKGEQLRGCIGSLQARRSLALDVDENAFAAAFRDPRFPPVSVSELAGVSIELSLLSPPTLLPMMASEATLLAALSPGRDGVVVQQAGYRATFLPKVWSHFAAPADFLAALRQKAGLPAEFDPAGQYSVYRVESFGEGDS